MADTTNNEVNLILGKLKRHFGKTMETATVRDVYESLALCVRDEIIDRWITSKEEIDKQGKKMMIFMSSHTLQTAVPSFWWIYLARKRERLPDLQ